MDPELQCDRQNVIDSPAIHHPVVLTIEAMLNGRVLLEMALSSQWHRTYDL